MAHLRIGTMPWALGNHNAIGTFRREFKQIVWNMAERVVKESAREDGFWRLRGGKNGGDGTKVGHIFRKLDGENFGDLDRSGIEAEIFRVVSLYEKDKTFCEAMALDFLLRQYSHPRKEFRRMGSEGRRAAIENEMKRHGAAKIKYEEGREVAYHTPLQIIDDGALPCLARHFVWRYGYLGRVSPAKVAEIMEAVSLAKETVAMALDAHVADAGNINGMLDALRHMDGRIGCNGNAYRRMEKAMQGENVDAALNAQKIAFLLSKLRHDLEHNPELMWIWEKLCEKREK